MNFSAQIIQEIKQGKQEALERLYCNERQPFLSWTQKYFECSLHEAKELYQVTILIAYDNIVMGKLVVLHCTFKSYLYAIAKNKWKEWQRAKSKVNHVDEYFFHHLIEDEQASVYSEESIKKMCKGLKLLGDPCQKILESYYYHRLSMEQISDEMAYKNASTAKNLKYKCLQRLRTLVIKSLKINEHVPQSFSH
jgi:RNA polymerase sigma-70 factor (ECF subfamily)